MQLSLAINWQVAAISTSRDANTNKSRSSHWHMPEINTLEIIILTDAQQSPSVVQQTENIHSYTTEASSEM